MNTDTLDSILRVFRTLHRLKELPRQGFIFFGLRRHETDSVAEHSFMVTWIAYVLARYLKEAGCCAGDDALVSKVVQVALVHDWAEAVAGDMGHHAKEVRGLAQQIEHRSFEALIATLPKRMQNELQDRWIAYNSHEQRETPEYAIVKFADALEGWLQGIVSSTTWWPAWVDYNRKTEEALARQGSLPQLAGVFRRMSDMARDPDVAVRLQSPLAQNRALSDNQLRDTLHFIQSIYCLKELPRHGFNFFGVKQDESDSLAGHMFTTASLSYLLSMMLDTSGDSAACHQAIMVALVHDLPAAVTGDVSYDLQELSGDEWSVSQKSALDRLTSLLGQDSQLEIQGYSREWNSLRIGQSNYVWIARAAAALDAWEMGVTTPTAWIVALGRSIFKAEKCSSTPTVRTRP